MLQGFLRNNIQTFTFYLSGESQLLVQFWGNTQVELTRIMAARFNPFFTADFKKNL